MRMVVSVLMEDCNLLNTCHMVYDFLRYCCEVTGLQSSSLSITMNRPTIQQVLSFCFNMCKQRRNKSSTQIMTRSASQGPLEVHFPSLWPNSSRLYWAFYYGTRKRCVPLEDVAMLVDYCSSFGISIWSGYRQPSECLHRKNQPKRCAKGNDWWLWDDLHGSCQWTERTHQ